MNRPVNDNRIKTTERKLEILTYALEKMEDQLEDAEGLRRENERLSESRADVLHVCRLIRQSIH